MLEWYPPEWNLHQSEEIYLNRMQPYVERIEDYRRGPGDIVMFKMGRTIAHGGIMLPDNRMIHSWKPSRGVSIVGLSNDYWRKHYYGAFRVRGVD
jgi:cell wall-associated NlpC family hydrolase